MATDRDRQPKAMCIHAISNARTCVDCANNTVRSITAKDWTIATRKQCAIWLRSANLPIKWDTEPWNRLPEDVRRNLTERTQAQ